jgi:hypothetical protein
MRPLEPSLFHPIKNKFVLPFALHVILKTFKMQSNMKKRKVGGDDRDSGNGKRLKVCWHYPAFYVIPCSKTLIKRHSSQRSNGLFLERKHKGVRSAAAGNWNQVTAASGSLVNWERRHGVSLSFELCLKK